MLEKINIFLSKRGKLVKALSKGVAKAGIWFLGRLSGFTVPEVALWSYQMLLGTWEKGTVAAAKSFLKPGMISVDIGAHVGYFSRIFSRLVGESGKVFAFEPHPFNFKILKDNTKKFGNIVLVNSAVSSVNGDLSFYESSVGSGSHSLVGSRYPFSRVIRVRGVRLDDYFKDKNPNLVKIDVEGAELEVLEGAKRLFSRPDAPVLILEFAPSVIRGRNLDPARVLNEVVNLGYKIWAIDDERKIKVPLESWESSEKFMGSIKKYVNLFCDKS